MTRTETLTERVRRQLPTAYAVQFTNGTHDEYVTLIHETFPDPYLEVDCTAIDDWDDFLATIADDLETDADRYPTKSHAVTDHFKLVNGSFVLYNFHALDRSTASDLAMYIKGLWEDLNFDEYRDFGIAITTADPSALFVANGDLSGRVLTLDLTEDA